MNKINIHFFKNLKIVAISQLVSRSGTVYLHSLLDNHPEVATIPANLDISCFYNKKNLSSNQYFKLFEKFNSKFFNTSKYNLKDNKHSMIFRLGKNKKSKILTDKKVFKKNFCESLDKLNKNPKNAIISLFYSYSLIHCRNLRKIKIILMHPHEKKNTLTFNKYFKKANYLVCIRNPIKSYESIIKKTRFISNYKNTIYYPSGQLLESSLDYKEFYDRRMNLYFIKIEELGKNLKKEMKKLCYHLKIKYHQNLINSTFGGLKYWGNTPYREYNKFNNKIHSQESPLPRRDKIILYCINKKFFEKFNYKKINLKFVEKIFVPIYFFLPLQDEIIFFKDNFLKFNKKIIKFILFYFPKKLLLLIISILNNFSKRY